MDTKSNQKIIIVGAGFAGLALAKALKNKPFDLLLIDKNNYHIFQPLLYQVATGGLEPDSIAYPIRRIFRKFKNFRFQMAEVTTINADKKEIETTVGAISYDLLVLATGTTNNFFNFDSIKLELLPLKSITDALDIRSYMMQNMEKLAVAETQEAKNQLMNIAIIGGGPSGVELAGAIAEMRRYVLPKDFPQFDFNDMSINLYEAASTLLSVMSERSSVKCLEYLEKLGVNVHLNAKVTDYKNEKIYLADGSSFSTDTVIWTAGVKANVIDGLSMASYLPNQRIVIDDFFRIQNIDNIYALGDLSAQVTEKNKRGDPQLATVAIAQGNHLAKNLIAISEDRKPEPFHYKHKGSLATIGRNKAVADLPRMHFDGVIAWLLWMFVHLSSLVGFRNKVVAMVDWIQNYLSYDRPLGLIIRRYEKNSKKHKSTGTEK